MQREQTQHGRGTDETNALNFRACLPQVGGSIVVVPSSGVESMNLGAVGGLASINTESAVSSHVASAENSAVPVHNA